jgi:hypothetical protein
MEELSMILQRGTVLNILHSGFSQLIGEDFPKLTIIADDNYSTVGRDWVIDAITTDPILSPSHYVNNVFDCDDYVLYLKTKISLYAQSNKLKSPLALGFIMTNRHAFNFCIDDNRDTHIINTQSDDKASTSDPGSFKAFLNLTGSNSIQLIYI